MHTQGPWTLRPGNTVFGGDRMLAMLDDRKIREVEAENTANGHLISAAPDLLEACQIAVALYFEVRQMGLGAGLPGLSDCEYQLKAAIAKAEGGPDGN